MTSQDVCCTSRCLAKSLCSIDQCVNHYCEVSGPIWKPYEAKEAQQWKTCDLIRPTAGKRSPTRPIPPPQPRASGWWWKPPAPSAGTSTPGSTATPCRSTASGPRLLDRWTALADPRPTTPSAGGVFFCKSVKASLDQAGLIKRPPPVVARREPLERPDASQEACVALHYTSSTYHALPQRPAHQESWPLSPPSTCCCRA